MSRSERSETGVAGMETIRSEMAFARGGGGAALLWLLEEKGHYPYSDMDRAGVV